MGKKIIFFNLPAVGDFYAAEFLLEELAKRGFEVIHYNEERLRDLVNHEMFEFKSYPGCDGYDTRKLTRNSSLFELGILLLKTAECITDVLLEETKKLKPDLILHSRFAIWGKVVSIRTAIPGISLFPAPILTPKRVHQYSAGKKRKALNFETVLQGRMYAHEALRFFEKYGLDHSDPDDVFLSKQQLNIVLVNKEFQLASKDFGDQFKFVGPLRKFPDFDKSYEYIYLSFGTIFNEELLGFAQKYLQDIAGLGYRVVISLGNNIDREELDDLPANVSVHRYIDQPKVLASAKVFITHGGANSVLEGIYYLTPMLAIPQTVEQEMNADTVHSNGLGWTLREGEVTRDSVINALKNLIEDKKYRNNIKSFKEQKFNKGCESTVKIIEDYLSTYRVQHQFKI